MRSHLFLCVLVGPFAAWAAPHSDDLKCNPDGTQLEMNVCAIRDFKAADATLNRQYGETMARISKVEQRRLRIQQRAWLKQRDRGCEEEVKESEGGSIWELEYYSCLAGVTQKRSAELKAFGAGS